MQMYDIFYSTNTFKSFIVKNPKKSYPPGLESVLVELTEKFRPETISDRKLMVL